MSYYTADQSESSIWEGAELRRVSGYKCNLMLATMNFLTRELTNGRAAFEVSVRLANERAGF